MTELVYQIKRDNTKFVELLNNIDVYFIPVVNKDGLYYISKQHDEKNQILEMIRKNMNFNYCNGADLTSVGVDLNRNYDSYFGEDNIGSSNLLCDESYRGPYAFSEPETSSIKKIVEEINLNSNNGLKIAINYHAWGNMLIIPPNHVKISDPLEFIRQNYIDQYNLYNDLILNGNLPSNVIIGNGYKTVEYNANGEAADWFLLKKNIVSFSPELGTKNISTELFYPTIKTSIEDIIPNNLPFAFYSINSLLYKIKFEINIEEAEYYNCKNYIENDFLKLDQNSNNKTILDEYCKDSKNIFYFGAFTILNEGLSDFLTTDESNFHIIFSINSNTDNFEENENLEFIKIFNENQKNEANNDIKNFTIIKRNVNQVELNNLQIEKSSKIKIKFIISSSALLQGKRIFVSYKEKERNQIIKNIQSKYDGIINNLNQYRVSSHLKDIKLINIGKNINDNNNKNDEDIISNIKNNLVKFISIISVLIIVIILLVILIRKQNNNDSRNNKNSTEKENKDASEIEVSTIEIDVKSDYNIEEKGFSEHKL